MFCILKKICFISNTQVYISSPSIDCGLFTGSMTSDGQFKLECEDGNGSFGSEASRAIPPLIERSFKGRRSELEMKLQPRAFDPKGYRHEYLNSFKTPY